MNALSYLIVDSIFDFEQLLNIQPKTSISFYPSL